ncbi:MAG: hypothetical protein ACFE0Q_05055 [Anaerolineae bacterium]
MEDIVAVNATQMDSLHTPEKVWLELHREKDACDVIVQMDDGTVYTALFAVQAYLNRQMDLQLQVTRQLDDTPPVRYCVIDTPHIMVEELSRDVIEDTIDNLIALDVFESHFTRVTENSDNTDTTRTSNGGRRATQEVAAVVISDVLVVQE